MVLLHYQLCNIYFWSFHSVHYYSKAGKIYGLVKSISVNSYGMFLMHMLWLPFWVSIIQPQISIAAAIPLISILTFISCYITTKLISYLPNSKWVIG